MKKLLVLSLLGLSVSSNAWEPKSCAAMNTGNQILADCVLKTGAVAGTGCLYVRADKTFVFYSSVVSQQGGWPITYVLDQYEKATQITVTNTNAAFKMLQTSTGGMGSEKRDLNIDKQNSMMSYTVSHQALNSSPVVDLNASYQCKLAR